MSNNRKIQTIDFRFKTRMFAPPARQARPALRLAAPAVLYCRNNGPKAALLSAAARGANIVRIMASRPPDLNYFTT